MQPTNKASAKRISRCMYCGSTTRGKGCRYAPHGVHFHPDDPKKCAYCASPNYGRGCKVNPTSDIHVHGINYNSMFKEEVESYLDYKVFINELKKPFVEFQAYKLNIIDENGNKIKTPITEEEQQAYNPFIKTVIKLKRYLGSKLDLIEAEQTLAKESCVVESAVKYKLMLGYKEKVQSLVNELYKTFDEASSKGLALNDIKDLIRA